MKTFAKIIPLLLACCWPGLAGAQLKIAAATAPWRVFPGPARDLPVLVCNTDKHIIDGEIRARTFQTTSSTAVLLYEKPWKKLKVLPGQTVMETTSLDFPAVKAETKFLVQWLENSNLIGQTQVLVYPTNLLGELKPLAGDLPVGVFDPQNQLKPLLKNLKLDFADLEISDVEKFPGHLAIIGPFASETQMRQGLGKQIQALEKKGAAVVWIQPPVRPDHKLRPSFYSILGSETAVVVAQPDLASNLVENPQAQLNLICLCQLAVNPRPFPLLDLSWQH